MVIGMDNKEQETPKKSGMNYFTVLTIVALEFVFLSFYLTYDSNKKENLFNDYLEYIEKPSYSTNNQVVLENSIYYIYMKKTVKINVLSDNKTLSWTSSDKSTVSVDKTGNAVGLKEGSADVTAMDTEGNSAKVTIVVVDPSKTTIEQAQKAAAANTSSEPVKKITFRETDVTIRTNTSKRLYVDFYPAGSSGKVTWTSSDPSVATVDNGKVTAIWTGRQGGAEGAVTITAKVGNVSKSINVKIVSQDRIHFISHGEGKADNKNSHTTGDAILLESNGSFAMIDLGDASAADRVVNYLKEKNVKVLDFLMITHMHADHTSFSRSKESLVTLQKMIDNGVLIKNIWLKDYSEKRDSSYKAAYDEDLAGFNNSDPKDPKKNYTNWTSKGYTYKLFMMFMDMKEKYKNQIKNINLLTSNIENKTFKNLKFTLSLYNVPLNPNADLTENYNSIVALYNVNEHKVLLAGDDHDTKMANEIAADIGKIGTYKVPHHGSRNCSLLDKYYIGDEVVSKNKSGAKLVKSTAMSKLNPKYYIVPSSKIKIANIRCIYGESMCVEKLDSTLATSKYNSSRVASIDETVDIIKQLDNAKLYEEWAKTDAEKAEAEQFKKDINKRAANTCYDDTFSGNKKFTINIPTDSTVKYVDECNKALIMDNTASAIKFTCE